MPKKKNKNSPKKNNSYPFVSVICPTYNRRSFLIYLIHQYDYQTYPKDRMELIIIDDSPENNSDIIPVRDDIRYIYLEEKIILSEKRNMLNNEAKGDIIVCFDDDDYYAPDRVEHAVEKLTKNNADLAGSSVLHIYFPELEQIYEYGPYGDNHATNGTMAYTKKYCEKHKYASDKKVAEEGSFTENFKEKLIQLDPKKVMLCISHHENTVNKRNFLKKGKKTDYDIKEFFKHQDQIMLDRIQSFVDDINKKITTDNDIKNIVVLSDISLNI